MEGVILRCLLLFYAAAGAVGTHFRGGIIMVRPQPDGRNNEVNDI